MLRAGVNDPKSPLVVCGLSDGNVMRLKDGKPIKADFRSFGVNLPGSLVIFHGPTEADMEATLKRNGLITDQTQQAADPRLDQEAAILAEHKHILIATVGLPRSGKSTWARSQSYPVVNPDSIRLAMHGQRYAERAEPFVWATAKVMVRSLFLAGHRVVILDATNTQRKRREEWQSKEWGTYFKLVNTPRDVCIERANAESDAEIVPVIERMHAGYETLDSHEKQWL